MPAPRVLIAGIGNVLRGDDGLGVEALHRVRAALGDGGGSVAYLESGIAGIALVQQLLDGYDALILLDALDRGASPGTVFVLEPDLDTITREASRGRPIDLHQADVEGVLVMAAALDVLPRRAFVVGVQAKACDELGGGLTPAVAAALDETTERVRRLVAQLRGAGDVPAT